MAVAIPVDTGLHWFINRIYDDWHSAQCFNSARCHFQASQFAKFILSPDQYDHYGFDYVTAQPDPYQIRAK